MALFYFIRGHKLVFLISFFALCEILTFHHNGLLGWFEEEREYLGCTSKASPDAFSFLSLTAPSKKDMS